MQQPKIPYAARGSWGNTLPTFAEGAEGPELRDPSPRLEIPDAEIRQQKNDLWKITYSIKKGDPVDVYLTALGLKRDRYPSDLRTCFECPLAGVKFRPVMSAMVAMVRDYRGDPCQLHRTYIDGPKKADIPAPCRIMPGEIPPGAAIRLGEYQLGEPLGIAVGVEAALSAAEFFDHTVWAVTSNKMLERWMPPEDVDYVTIYGSNESDTNFAAQAAAYKLAEKIKSSPQFKHIKVSVCIPPLDGDDWNDELQAGKGGSSV